jgi:hypothetical protein
LTALKDFNVSPNRVPGEPFKILGVDLSTAISAFCRRVKEFLTSRYSAPPGTVEPEYAGLPFEVTSRTNGLRVYVSPAYYWDPNRVWGYPTSPLKGLLRPGRYIFSATSSMNERYLNPGEWDVPPHRMVHLEF